MKIRTTEASKETYIREAEARPNRAFANSLIGVIIALLVLFVLVETNTIQSVSKVNMRVAYVPWLAFFAAVQIASHIERVVRNKWTKYFFVLGTLALTLLTSSMVHVFVIAILMVPLSLSTVYYSKPLLIVTVCSSVLISAVSPVIAYGLNAISPALQNFVVSSVGDYTLKTTILMIGLPSVGFALCFGIFATIAYFERHRSLEKTIDNVDVIDGLNKEIRECLENEDRLIFAMSDMVDIRDNSHSGHVRRTSEAIAILVEEMRKDKEASFDDEYLNMIIKAAPMHDLGKIAIEDSILNKPGKLTPLEYEVIKSHPARSFELINQVVSDKEAKFKRIAMNIARFHHERMDSTGYPDHLSGNEIPLEAKVMAIVDVYDALVSKRVYKEPMSFEEAFNTIEESMGTQFDPDLNKYFLAAREEIEKYYSKELEQ